MTGIERHDLIANGLQHDVFIQEVQGNIVIHNVPFFGKATITGRSAKLFCTRILQMIENATNKDVDKKS